MNGLSRFAELPNGDAVELRMNGVHVPFTVWARPGDGDTVTIWYSCDGGTTYTEWAAGAVTAYTETTFVSPVSHIKGQRTSGSGTSSAFGAC